MQKVLKTKAWDFPGSPVVKTLPSTAGGVGSIPGQGTKVLPAAGCGQKLKKKKEGKKRKKGLQVTKTQCTRDTPAHHISLLMEEACWF